MEISASVSSNAQSDTVRKVATSLEALVGAPIEVRPDFRAAGIETEALAWIVALNLPAIALKEFLKLLVKDGYGKARERIRDLTGANKGPEGSVILRSSVWVRLDEQLPDEAFTALLDLAPDEYSGEMIVWDDELAQWVAD